MNVKLDVLMGLPGSGKTTLAKKLYEENQSSNCLFSLDEAKSDCYYLKDKGIEDFIYHEFRKKYRKQKRIILDGLILTNDDIIKSVTYLSRFFKDITLTIHRFEEDRETCIKNDGGRREISSINTIENAKYENVDIEKLTPIFEEYGITLKEVINHEIVLKPDWYRYTRATSYVFEDGKIRSEKWCIGGSYGNCWDNHLSPVSPDEPLEFKQFDTLLESIAPQITFLQYKKLHSECVSTETSYVPDYYGGGVTNMNWVCDLPKLYELLKEYGFSF